jgi:hypothetical protein
LTPDTLIKINEIVVKAGHKLVKKKMMKHWKEDAIHL